MFPLKANDPYIKATGERFTLGSVVGGGGSDTPELPDYSIADAGKVLTVDDEGSLEWHTNSGGGNIYKGTTVPSNSVGNEGDIYLLMPGALYQSFDITIRKAIRGDTEQSYYGAQEIQLMFTNGEQTKDIIEFSGFTCSGPGSVAYAFNGETTTGTYWEASSLPGVVQFGAIIPPEWELDKLIVWQRNSSTYFDVWKEFTFSVNGVPVINEEDLTADDWAGPGLGTEFEIPPIGLKNVQNVYYKINYNGDVIWIS